MALLPLDVLMRRRCEDAVDGGAVARNFEAEGTHRVPPLIGEVRAAALQQGHTTWPSGTDRIRV